MNNFEHIIKILILGLLGIGVLVSYSLFLKECFIHANQFIKKTFIEELTKQGYEIRDDGYLLKRKYNHQSWSDIQILPEACPAIFPAGTVYKQYRIRFSAQLH